ncbi:hypothetical protein COU20_03840 [Candidatus Kaiserbacteria bacterium CG10_big_fil_rev_8_21_14_0_10_59_10]|uniref:PDZ domain-containing protein n=1 Tax=Candidatus Kaiserbacteria bacterium CG10_big_fil_rev_8_21_14_0_10_59_10 TaxID=1974612 RepID=A0A2H0U775_9BACT|nr:MAG: hypothetical protein COU20_03840 [Candidatus Kaiserbacteria bacterium CG10_big_fil_rev_8_21_14_0_10_59_10]
MDEERHDSRTVVLAVVALVGTGAAFFFGMSIGARSSMHAALPAQVGSALGVPPTPPEGVDFTPVWRAWSAIDERYVPSAISTTTEPVASDEERVWGMIQGLASSLGDPYTLFLPPADKEQFEEDMSGAFEGVGMEIAIRDQVLTVVSPLRGTPAERAGIQAGDRILRIDGEETRGLDITSAVRKIRGPKGSTVVLTVIREGWSEPRELPVVRDVINIPIVTTELRPDGIFVIQLASFTSNSPGLFREALREFIQSGSSRLILDLRGNPGGFLEAAVDMASWFVPSGRVIVTEDYAGNSPNVVHRSRGYNVFNDQLEMVILVDRGSASASEILAAALAHWRGVTLVGVNTFGKGSVQELVSITPDTSLKLTVARWLLPDGSHIPLDGIAPDVEVERTPEDREKGNDPQMDEAVKLLAR